jgi:hypothetical protein
MLMAEGKRGCGEESRSRQEEQGCGGQCKDESLSVSVAEVFNDVGTRQ